MQTRFASSKRLTIGLDLAKTDLLKNYLFHLSGNRMAEVQQRWMAMLGTLDVVGGEEITVQYIRHFVVCKIRTDKRARPVRSHQTDSHKQTIGNRLLHTTRRNARVYAAISNTDHDLWNKQITDGAIGNIWPAPEPNGPHPDTASSSGHSRQLSPAEVKKSLRLFVSWAVRFLIVGGLGGGTLESHYSQRAKEVTDGTIKNASQLLKAMRHVIPTDERFEAEFATATASKPALARYYLFGT